MVDIFVGEEFTVTAELYKGSTLIEDAVFAWATLNSNVATVEDGTVTAVGTHNELCSSCEEYAKMVKLQKLEDEGGDI